MFYLALPFHLFTGAFSAMPAVLFGLVIGAALGLPGALVSEQAPPWDASVFCILFIALCGGATDALGLYQVNETGDRDPDRVARPRLVTTFAGILLFGGLVAFGRVGAWFGMMACILLHGVYMYRKLEQLPAPGGERVYIVLLSIMVLCALVEPSGLWRAMFWQ